MPTVSAVGMRMGATIVGKAALEHDLELSSFVMWDPASQAGVTCGTGRAGGLAKRCPGGQTSGTSKMMEFPVSDKTAEQLKAFSLMDGGSTPGTTKPHCRPW